MKVAICDDDRLCRARVTDVAADYQEQRQDKDVSFEVFSLPEELLRSVQNGSRYDIFILDIVMPGLNGIQLGQALRTAGADGKIIYLTSSKEYALDSFQVRAFHYLLKPIERDAFFSVMDEAVAAISLKQDKSLIIKTKESNARITFDSILYAELSKRAVVYYLTGGKTITSTTLRTTFTEAVQELLADRRFTLCGASMAVNMHHITMIESEGVVFQNTNRVLLGKKACRELRTAWNLYWITEGGKV